MRRSLLLSALFVAGCSAECPKVAEAPPPPAPKMISEADAAAMLDKVPMALMAKDVAGGVAQYADNAVMLDISAPEVITTKEGNTAATNDFLKANVSKMTLNQRNIQVLDADNFVATQIVTVDMAPAKKPIQQIIRVTDVAHKGADGSWKFVEEHLSAMPTPPKAKLPVVKEYTAPAATPAAPAAPAGGAKPADAKPADAKPATPAPATPAKPATPPKPN